ncbi:iron(III) transport system permease protein [Sinobaca qinghaiensis]|uniref:Iron(III) transport system permease protein n=1 Tax=Sinobaca qinghaiensis TaxID=342944 RepID=A0A419V8Y8_9BACL|nr:iron ABC transporter permease [Sinobaca qinghaiensis]RKD76438.1 iron(III) transport system permease protein [Sinobaca qinghaiensis]
MFHSTGLKKERGTPPLSFLLSALAKRRIFGGISLLLLFIFFVLPLLRLVELSFSGEEGFTFSVYQEVWREASTWTTLWNTVIIVGVSTLFSAGGGLLAAIIVAYSDIRGKSIMHLFILLPFVIPSYIVTLAWTQLFSSNGWVAALLEKLPGDIAVVNLYSMGGIIFVLSISHFPLVYLLTVSVLRRIPRELEAAARVSGAGKWQTFRTVYWPLALPGLAGGGLLAFLASLDNFGIPAFLGIPANIPVLSTAIYQEIAGFGPQAFSRAAVLASLLGAAALIGTLFQWLLTKKSQNHETSYEDTAPRFTFGKYRKYAEIIIWSFLFIISIIPLTAMAAASLSPAFGAPFRLDTITFEHYRFLLAGNSQVSGAITNSLTLALITTFAALVIGTTIAYFRVYRPSAFSKSAELSIALPYALPGTVLALALIFTWMQPVPGWNPGVYGSIWILIIAYITRFTILQGRASTTAFMQIGQSMQEAARSSGAGFFSLWRKIMIPLMLSGLAGGAFLVFLSALAELTVSALLWSSGNETIGVMIFQFEQAGYTTHSTAFSSLIVGGMAVIGIGLLLLKKRLEKRGVTA